MNKCAVIIGVNKTGGMPMLDAAVRGAIEFRDWAQSQGYDFALHTDEGGKGVKIGDIKASIRNFVDSGRYHLMIVFFAGHGILKSAMDEFWLLSGAPDDPNEAVSVQASRFLARRCGIPHVVFISDACRSVPNNPLVSEIFGSVIFPNMPPRNATCDIDMFYATIPGNPAYEVREDEATRNYKGIFTTCLLKGLSGQVPEVISTVSDNPEKFPAVLAYELKTYLTNEVPRVAEAINITLSQSPDAEITSRPPKYLARLKSEAGQPAPESLDIDGDISVGAKDPIKKYKESKNNQMRRERHSNDILQSEELLMQAKGRESFETRTGFTIVGNAEVVPIGGNQFDQFEENGAQQIRIFGEKATTLIIRLPNSNVVPLAVLPQFIGTVVLQNDAVLNVNYLPSRGTPKYFMAEQALEEIQRRRARIAASAYYGKFDIEGSPEKILGEASYLRNEKALDPTLGLYASYAYAQAAGYREMISVYEYMIKEQEPVLFDVAMLARIAQDYIEFRELPAVIDPNFRTAPFCPVLTQGWSYMVLKEELFSPALKQLSKHLVPGLWTTFTSNGFEQMRNQLNSTLTGLIY